MRCPDCNKFVSYADEDEVSVESEAASYDAKTKTVEVRCEVRIVKTCGECGTELKEATLEIERTIDGVEPDAFGHDATGEPLDWTDLTVSCEVQSDSWSKGKGRWTETFYGVSGEIEVYAGPRGKDAWHDTITVNVKDDDACVAASSMDEMV